MFLGEVYDFFMRILRTVKQLPFLLSGSMGKELIRRKATQNIGCEYSLVTSLCE